ncbi:hypothetical protein [Halorubrum vacuolatum]|uniref:Uncharacterized protein n=1 Tax=Halorubrum vacuolatum TaxID=63740 RepID=A0A238VUY2_HALVU|nr:hypothetical protein [Halorubrum vacuolatum]SNR37991.1 hypothetical protein SAMN06264855_104100 [Halorubrum vacuolatum]
MYDRTYGTEWTELDRGEAIDRAFALGVMAAGGTKRRRELSRLLETADSAYDRSLIQLAYDEGRTQGLEASAEDTETLWKELVDELGNPREAPLPAAVPGAITELTLLRKRSEGLPSSLDLPSMLRK